MLYLTISWQNIGFLPAPVCEERNGQTEQKSLPDAYGVCGRAKNGSVIDAKMIC